MAISAVVGDLQLTILYRGELDLTALVEATSGPAFPLLGGVDEYGLTIFNALQVAQVLDEAATAGATSTGELAQLIAELRSATDVVLAGPHRYLVFIGN